MSQTPTSENNDWTIEISMRINEETKWSLRSCLLHTPENEGAAIQFVIEKFAGYVREQYGWASSVCGQRGVSASLS